MENKKSIFPVFIGMILGAFLLIVVIISLGTNLALKAKEDYSDEIQVVTNIFEDSKEPVFQKSYLLAGLLISPQFQYYLEEGIEKGWWTEEFLNQELTDNILPVYARQFAGISKIISETGKVDEIKEIISKIKDKLGEMDLDKIKETLFKIRDKILSLDFSRLILIINNLKEAFSNLNPEQIKIIINKIKDKLENLNLDIIKDKIEEIKDKIDEIKDKLNEIKDEIKDKVEDIKDKIEDIESKLDLDKIKDIINKIKDAVSNFDSEEIKDKIDEIKDKIKDIIDGFDLDNIKDKIEDIIDNIKDKVEDIIDEIEDIIDEIEDIINNINTIVNNIIDYIKNTLINLIVNGVFGDKEDDGFNLGSYVDGLDGTIDGNITIGSTTIPSSILNGIDLRIDYLFEENDSLIFTDDRLYVTQITLTTETVDINNGGSPAGGGALGGSDSTGGGFRYIIPVNYYCNNNGKCDNVPLVPPIVHPKAKIVRNVIDTINQAI